MELKLFILLAGVLLTSAAPAEKSATKPKDDLKAEEGRQHYTLAKSADYASDYSGPSPLYASPHRSALHREGPAYGGYASSSSYVPSQSESYGSRGTVSSYNRRGQDSGHPSDFAKPALYGSRYNAPLVQQAHRPSAYSGPRDYAFAQPSPSYALPPSSYDRTRDHYSQSAPNNLRYVDYGPANAYSSESVQRSQDPSYDPAKDPVSQYAAYIPTREYGPKTNKDNRELSIYGY